MASGGNRKIHGTYVGTGSAISIHTIGFRPSRVILKSRAGDEAYWARGVGDTTMPDAAMHKRTAAGVGSYVTVNGVTPLSDGFTIGADGDLNVATEVVDYEALD